MTKLPRRQARHVSGVVRRGLPRLEVSKGVWPLCGDIPRRLALLEEWARQDSEPAYDGRDTCFFCGLGRLSLSLSLYG